MEKQGNLFDEAVSAQEVDAARWIGRVRAEFSVFVSAAGVAEVRMLKQVEKPRVAPRLDARASKAAARLIRKARGEIEEYLAGARRRFGLDADLSALTPFMQKVLRETERIPYGQTRSYGWVAARAGSPGGARAAGQALHRNPVPLLIP